MRLYEIANELQAILDPEDGEIDAEALDGLTLAFADKVEALLKYHESLVAEQHALNQEAERLLARSKKRSKKAEWLRNYLKENMIRLGMERIGTTTFNVMVAKSPLKVELTEPENTIPSCYIRETVSITLDKAKVLEDFKAGREINPLVRVTQGNSLRIS